MNVLTAWAASGVGLAVAAGVTPVAVAAERSIDALPMAAWYFLIGWAFIGWIIASLKLAVIAMNDRSEPRSVVIAGIISTLVAALAVGVMAGLYLLTEARWDDKPLPALYAYIGALAGGYWGRRGMDFGLDLLRGIIERYANKGKT